MSSWKTNRRTKKPFLAPGEINPSVGALGHMRYACELCGQGIVQGVEYSVDGKTVCSQCYEKSKTHQEAMSQGYVESPESVTPVLAANRAIQKIADRLGVEAEDVRDGQPPSDATNWTWAMKIGFGDTLTEIRGSVKKGAHGWIAEAYYEGAEE